MSNLQTALYPWLLRINVVIKMQGETIATIDNLRHLEQLETARKRVREAQLALVGLPDDLVAWDPPQPDQ